MNPYESKIVGVGYAFDDVLILPRLSSIRSRYNREIDTSTYIANGMPKIKLPILSANMDTVTEHEMAMEMAFRGGLGVIHRFMPIKQQAHEVSLVKERMRLIEEHPPVISRNASINDAKELLNRRKRGYIIVYDNDLYNGDFSGIITTRDIEADEGKNNLVSSVMTHRDDMILATEDVTSAMAIHIMRTNRIQKLPLVRKDGKLRGVYTLKDYEYYERYPDAALDKYGRLMVGAAIGVQKKEVERALALIDAQVDVLVLDIAHGGLDYTAEMLYELKVINNVTTPIIAGNVATVEGVKYLIDSGADGIKGGISAGFVCETRDVAGVGVPQITAILNMAEYIYKQQTPCYLIADGGVRKPADFAKAIGAGANAVMVGSMLAGTKESPGEIEIVNKTMHKRVRGMASKLATAKRQELGETTTNMREYAPEGRNVLTPYKGNAVDVIYYLRGGLLSAMSYTNSRSIPEFHNNAQFIVSHTYNPEQKRPLGE